MATNQQRRKTAQQKLAQQLQDREARARKQRLVFVVGGAVVAVALIVGLVLWLTHGDKDKSSEAAGTPTSKAPAPINTPIDYAQPAPGAGAGLPAFVAPADLGLNCQYPASGKAAKQVDPPRTGKVPTDPKRVSVSIKTNQGNIGLQLDNQKAPCTVNSFASLTQKGYFDNTPCHRLSTSGLGMLQCGDPSGTGAGGPGYSFANEYPTNQYAPKDPALEKPVLYPRGTIAMANAGPNTNGSQFFLLFKDSHLPPNYTVFGVIDDTGLATLDKIAEAGDDGSLDPSPGGGKPKLPVTIEDVQLD